MVKDSKKLRIHYIRHVPFEGLGQIEAWANSKGHEVSLSRMYEPETKFPPLETLDWLIVMGGPMGTYDEVEYPWLIEEKEYIEKAIETGKTVIGICLGAQLIAEVTGGRVYKGEHREIGWHPIKLTKAGKDSKFFKGFPSELDVLQWHGDTFDLSDKCELLVKGELYKNQAFSCGEKVLGLQFHLEFDDACVKRLYDIPGEFKPGPYSQPEEEVRKEESFEEAEKLLFRLFENLSDIS